MTVGLPGTGIGGLFYLLTAFLMPVRELGLTLRGRSTFARWRAVVLQVALAGGILGGLWLTAWSLNRLCPREVHTALQASHLRVATLVGVTPAAFTLLLLAGLLAGVEVLRVLLWPSLPASSARRGTSRRGRGG